LPFLIKDLDKKMVFLGGPRQVGKTTLAQSLLKDYSDGHPAYFNWDDSEHRDRLRKRNWPSSERLIVFDEIHKMSQWRSWIKGIYDTKKNSYRFLVTGSARLDHFRKGGDSLLGRYHYYRMHPFSSTELGGTRAHTERLLKFGGFPEPLLSGDETTLRRWHLSRLQKLVRQDLRDVAEVGDLNKVELLAEALPARIGSPLSIRNLAQDLEIDPKTCKRWIELLDALYFSFRISPFGAPRIKAVKKEQKLYLWDWSQIEEEGARFENFVASHLLKLCHHLEDTEGYKMELRYLRDVEKREVDFVVLKQGRPQFAVECKLSRNSVAEQMHYFKARTGIPRFYQIHLGSERRELAPGVELLPFEEFALREKLV